MCGMMRHRLSGCSTEMKSTCSRIVFIYLFLFIYFFFAIHRRTSINDMIVYIVTIL